MKLSNFTQILKTLYSHQTLKQNIKVLTTLRLQITHFTKVMITL